MDASLWLLLALTVTGFVVAFVRDRDLPQQGLSATGKLVRNVGLEVALGFLLAGLIDVLIPAATMVKWLGGEHTGRAMLVAWVAGLVIPGGPYVFFPVVANLFTKGVGAGPLICLITAKTLVSPIRMLTYEAPLVGWPLTLARLVPGLLLPPVLGLLGEWLFKVFGGAPQR
ncbi:MAG: permease [Myxococcaceae bacterium]